jgi:hypothetical protein
MLSPSAASMHSTAGYIAGPLPLYAMELEPCTLGLAPCVLPQGRCHRNVLPSRCAGPPQQSGAAADPPWGCCGVASAACPTEPVQEKLTTCFMRLWYAHNSSIARDSHTCAQQKCTDYIVRVVATQHFKPCAGASAVYANPLPALVTNLALRGFFTPAELSNKRFCIRIAVRLVLCGGHGTPVRA